MEMTVDVAEGETQAPGRSIWEEFTSTVRDMPAKVLGGGDRDEPWMRAKRGRESTTDFGGVEHVGTGADPLAGHGCLNLNLSPDKLGGSESMGGRGSSIAPKGRGMGGRGRGRACGRGAGRGKRPPPVQPRYTSTASVCILSPVFA